MALLVLYGNNANYVGESLEAQRATVAAYQCIRFTQLCFFLMYSVASHHHRTQNRIYAALTFIAVCLWTPIYFESISNRAKIGVAVVAILWEQFAYLAGFSPACAKMLGLEFTTAVDIDHENDRYTAFTIIVLGEFTYYILVGSPAESGLTYSYMRAVWTLVIAFCFNSMYVYTDGAIDNVHPIRRSVYTAFVWLLIHLPMSAGLLIGGHVSAVATSEELDSGRRWLWGGGLGFGTLCMWIIAQLWRDRDPAGKLQLSKVRAAKLARGLIRIETDAGIAIPPGASSAGRDHLRPPPARSRGGAQQYQSRLDRSRHQWLCRDMGDGVLAGEGRLCV